MRLEILAVIVAIACAPPLAFAELTDTPTDASQAASGAPEAPTPGEDAPPAVEPLTAHPGAPGAVAPTLDEALGLLASVVQAVREGQWRLVASGALLLLMFSLSVVRDRVPWFAGDRGGALLVMLLGLSGAFGTALATSAPLGWDLIFGAVGVTWTAVGGYSWAKRLIWPQDGVA